MSFIIFDIKKLFFQVCEKYRQTLALLLLTVDKIPPVVASLPADSLLWYCEFIVYL